MADSSILHEFLVRIGFAVDDSAKRRYDEAMASGASGAAQLNRTIADVGKQLGLLGTQLIAVSEHPTRKALEASDRLKQRHVDLTKEVKSLGLTTVATTTAFVAGFTEIARHYEQLYYISQRTGIAAKELSGLSFVGPQVGLGSRDLVAAMDAVTTAARNPGIEMFIRGFLHADPRNLRSIIDSLKGLPPWEQDMAAGMIHLDTVMMRTLINNPQWVTAQKEFEDFQRRAGINADEIAVKGKQITAEWEAMWKHLGVIADQAFEEAYPTLERLLKAVDDLVKKAALWNTSHPGAAMAEGLIAAAPVASAATGLLTGAGVAGSAALGGATALGIGAAGAGMYMGADQQRSDQVSLLRRALMMSNPITGLFSAGTGVANWMFGIKPPPLYQHGGIVPQDQLARVHGEEMVLPPEISGFIVSSMSAARGTGAEGDTSRSLKDWLSGSSTQMPYVRVVGISDRANWAEGTVGGEFGPGGPATRRPGDFGQHAQRSGGRFGGMSPGAGAQLPASTAPGTAAEEDMLKHIAAVESRNQNIWNFRHNERPNYYTASGYWQVVRSNWRKYGPQVGVDLQKYPDAVDAPFEMQHAVALRLYRLFGPTPWDKAHGGPLPVGYQAHTGSAGVGAAGGQPPYALGDSLAAGVIDANHLPEQWSKVPGDKENYGIPAVWGRNPRQVLQTITQHIKELEGRQVLLSSGASNDITQLNYVRRQLEALREAHARTTLLGVGSGVRDYRHVNEALGAMAKEYGADFGGEPPGTAGGRVHPTGEGYKRILDQVTHMRGASLGAAPTTINHDAGDRSVEMHQTNNFTGVDLTDAGRVARHLHENMGPITRSFTAVMR